MTIDFGGHSERVTPVPIPNTEVKPLSADGTWDECPWESRTPPDFLVTRRDFRLSSLRVLALIAGLTGCRRSVSFALGVLECPFLARASTITGLCRLLRHLPPLLNGSQLLGALQAPRTSATRKNEQLATNATPDLSGEGGLGVAAVLGDLDDLNVAADRSVLEAIDLDDLNVAADRSVLEAIDLNAVPGPNAVSDPNAPGDLTEVAELRTVGLGCEAMARCVEVRRSVVAPQKHDSQSRRRLPFARQLHLPERPPFGSTRVWLLVHRRGLWHLGPSRRQHQALRLRRRTDAGQLLDPRLIQRSSLHS